MVDATTQQEQERYNALVAEKERLANELNVMQSQGILWNDPRYQSTQQQYGYITQQIPLAYERQKSAQNIEAGIIGSSGASPDIKTITVGGMSLPTPFVSSPSGTPSSAASIRPQTTVDVGGMQLPTPFVSQSVSGQYEQSASRVTSNVQPTAPQNQAQMVSALLQSAGFSAESARIAGDTTARSTTSAYTTQYTPYGERTQQELLNTRVAVDPRSGEIGYYQVPINPMTGLPRTGVYGAEGGGILIGGGSRSAAQSGMFSTGVAGTPDIRTQYNPERYAPTANVEMATIVRSSPESFSRLGAEAYSGQVAPLDSRTLTPESQVSRYPAWTGNLANLAQQVAPSKSEYGGAYIPWAVPLSSPDTMYMGERGITGAAPSAYSRMASMEYTGPLFGMGSRAGIQNPTVEGPRLIIGGPEGVRYGESIAAPSDRLIGGGKVAGIGTTIPTTPTPEVSLPTWESQKSKFTPEQQRFIQFGLDVSSKEAERAFTPTTTETIQPTGEIPFFGVVPGVSPVVARFQPVTTVTKSGFGEVRSEGKSAYESFLDVNYRSMIPSVETGETALRAASLINPVSTPSVVSSMILERVAPDKAAGAQYFEPLKGQYQLAYESPATIPISYVAGGVFGAGARGLGAVASKSDVLTRAAPAASRVGGVVLGSVYGGTVVYESTKGFKEFAPSNIAAIRTRATQEAYPMAVGFGAGYALPESSKPALSRMSEVMSGERGTTTELMQASTFDRFRSSLPTYTGIKAKYTEMTTPGTAMSGPMAGERYISTGAERSLYRYGTRSRENPALARNRESMEFYSGRIRSRPSGQMSAQNPMLKVMGEQPRESRIGVTAMGGKSEISGFLVQESPLISMRDTAGTGKSKIAGMLAQFQKPVVPKTPYVGVETKTPGGILMSRAEVVSVSEPVVVSKIEATFTPLQQRSRLRYVEQEQEYYRTPEGMTRPAPQESTVSLKRMQPEFTMLKSESASAIGVMQMQEQRRGLQNVFATKSKSMGIGIESGIRMYQGQRNEPKQISEVRSRISVDQDRKSDQTIMQSTRSAQIVGVSTIGIAIPKSTLPMTPDAISRKTPFDRAPQNKLPEPQKVPFTTTVTPWFDLPRGGSRGSPFRGARYRSTAAQYRVGADILGATRGSFQPLRMPKRMSFRMPKF